ncbi:NACHT domain-containing protein [Streptomyces sp. 4N509B]|uniref:NACHT domain-containing protein n=1 Tax=Streptomyces sp. 4N509B TaxID=3457413 RepID=UPI003FD26019
MAELGDAGRPGSRDGDTVNLFHGDARVVVQFRDLYGNLSINVPAATTPSEEERAAHALAEAVFRQWREEAKVWDVGGDRTPLAIEWRARERRADHPENVGGSVGRTADGPCGGGDDVGDIVSPFLALPQRRLVILGGAGSGKSALAIMMTLDLLKRRLLAVGPNDPDAHLPVPVVLPLTAWDPDREEFGAWLVRRLAEDYPALPRVGGDHPARALWKASPTTRLLPVLDGLDEMPRDRQATAIRSLNRALYEGHPLILTSRTEEFDALARHPVLRSAAVVEAQPVKAADAEEYLRRSAPPDALHRFGPLFETLTKQPTAPAATALSTPLMLWLARTVYSRPWSDPGELADQARLPTRAAVEDHLLDALVPTVFAGQPVASGDRHDPPRRWSPRSAQRWLRYLAGHLERRGTTELAWWRLHLAALPSLLVLPALVALGLAVSAAGSRLTAWYRDEQSQGSRWEWQEFTFTSEITTALLSGLTLGVVLQFVVRIWYSDYRFGEPRRIVNPLRLGATLRAAAHAITPWRAVGAVLAVVLFAAILLLAALSTPSDLGGRQFGNQAIGLVVAAALVILLAAPATAEDEVVTPERRMRGEHVAVAVTLCVIAPVIGYAVGASAWHEPGTAGRAVAVAGWLGAATMLLGVSPWSRWLLARGSLALAGRVPFSLMRFLHDARRHGVLREVGATYQFRNRRLQQRLAERASGGGPAAVFGHAARRAPELPGDAITVLRDGGVVIRLRRRRLAFGPIMVLLPLIGLTTLRIAVTGGTEALPVIWGPAVVLLVLGGAPALAAFVMPRRTDVLRITRDHLECRTGLFRLDRYAWRHVEDVAVRRTRFRGVDTRLYGIHVRLDPAAPRGPRLARSDGPWYTLCRLGLHPVLPWQVEAALRHFAAERWRPPALSSLPGGDGELDWQGLRRELLRHGAHEEQGPAPAGDPTMEARERVTPVRRAGGGAGAAVRVAVVGALVVAATVPTLTSPGGADMPGWSVVAAVAGLLLLCTDLPFGYAGRLAALLRLGGVLSFGLSTAAVLAVTVPPDPLGWADLLAVTALALVQGLCQLRLRWHATRRTQGRITMSWAFTLLVQGYAVLPSAAADGTPGAVAFLAYLLAALLILLGVIAGLDPFPDGARRKITVTVGATTDQLSWVTPAVVAWHVLVVGTLVAGAGYAAWEGGSAVCWIIAVGTVLLVVPGLLSHLGQRVRAQRGALG